MTVHEVNNNNAIKIKYDFTKKDRKVFFLWKRVCYEKDNDRIWYKARGN